MTPDQWNTILSVIVGFVLPALVSVVNREPWANWIKALVALLSSVLGGTIVALVGGSFNGMTWLQDIGIVFAASQAFYHTWWKGSGIADWIEQNINLIAGKVNPPTARHAAPVAPVHVQDGTAGASMPTLEKLMQQQSDEGVAG